MRPGSPWWPARSSPASCPWLWRRDGSPRKRFSTFPTALRLRLKKTWKAPSRGTFPLSGVCWDRRLLSPGEDAEVWQYQNGQWVAVDTTRNGQYLLLTMEGTQGTFFLQPKGNGLWIPVLLTAGGAAGLGVLLLIASKRKRAKKAVKVQKEQEEPAPK